MGKKLLIFTDLDGSFLDHHTYDYTPLLPVLERLRDMGALIIPTTSKTLAEIEALDLPLGEGAPAIAENGMVMSFQGEQRALGKSYEEIRSFLSALPQDMRSAFNGFSDMSVADVMDHTGLSEPSAQLARTRLGSEPFLWSGNDEQMNALKIKAEHEGLTITRGGRFYHLMSKGGKDKAMLSLAEEFRKQAPGHQIQMIALGDGPNDADMLAVADIGVQIPNANGPDFEIQNARGQIIKAPEEGPQGWALAMSEILDNLPFES